MTSRMALAAALGFGLVNCPAMAQDEAAYPAREVLAAFATACSGIENLAVAKASVLAAGWQPIPADDDGLLTQLVQIGKNVIAEEEADEETKSVFLEGGEYRTMIAGRELNLAISGVRMDRFQSHGCRVYDFTAPAALSVEELESWAVRKPNGTQELPEGLVKHVWNPGLKPGHMEMEVNFIPAAAMQSTGIPLSGLVLGAAAMEFID